MRESDKMNMGKFKTDMVNNLKIQELTGSRILSYPLDISYLPALLYHLNYFEIPSYLDESP